LKKTRITTISKGIKKAINLGKVKGLLEIKGIVNVEEFNFYK